MKNLSKTEKENIVKRCLSGEGITVLLTNMEYPEARYITGSMNSKCRRK